MKQKFTYSGCHAHDSASFTHGPLSTVAEICHQLRVSTKAPVLLQFVSRLARLDDDDPVALNRYIMASERERNNSDSVSRVEPVGSEERI